VVAGNLVGKLVLQGEVVGAKNIGSFGGLPPTDAVGQAIESDRGWGSSLTGLLTLGREGDTRQGMQGFVATGVEPLFNELVELGGRDLSLLEFTAEEIVSVTESFKKGGEKRREDAGVAKEQFAKLLPVHEVKAGRFKGAGRSGAGFIIEQGHFAEDISRKKMTEGGIALPVNVNGDFDTAF
jgi:hypothetical protein